MKTIVIALGVTTLSLIGFLSCKKSEQGKEKIPSSTERSGSKIELIIVTNNGDRDSIYARVVSSYYFELLSTLAICVLTTSIVSFVSRMLDRKFDWYQFFFSRIVLQSILGIGLPSVVAYLLVILLFQLLKVNILSTNNHLFVPYIVILTIGFNVFYNVRHIVPENVNTSKMPSPPNVIKEEMTNVDLINRSENYSGNFMVHTPTGSFPLPLNEIAYFYRRRGYVYLRRTNGIDHIVAQSLDQIQLEVPASTFFRAARHMLANYNAIGGYFPLDYGKLGLYLRPAFKEEITISKLLAKDFKMWMHR